MLFNFYLSFKNTVLYYSTGFVDYNYQINAMAFLLVSVFFMYTLYDFDKHFIVEKVKKC